jgi:hypothetical protein
MWPSSLADGDSAAASSSLTAMAGGVRLYADEASAQAELSPKSLAEGYASAKALVLLRCG